MRGEGSFKLIASICFAYIFHSEIYHTLASNRIKQPKEGRNFKVQTCYFLVPNASDYKVASNTYFHKF